MTYKIKISPAILNDYESCQVAAGELSILGAAAEKVRAIPGKSGTIRVTEAEAAALVRDFEDRADIYYGGDYAGLSRAYRTGATKVRESLKEVWG